MLLCEGEKVISLLFVEGSTGRIAWEIVEDSHRMFVHHRLKIGNLWDEFMLEQTGVIFRFAAHEGRIGTIEGKVRLREEDVFTWVDEGHEKVEQCVSARHCHANIVFIHARLVGRPRSGDLLSKSRQSGGGGVFVAPVEHRLVEGLNGDSRRLKIRLTEAKGDDIVSRQIEHLAYAGRLNRKSTVAKGAHSVATSALHFNAITILGVWTSPLLQLPEACQPPAK